MKRLATLCALLLAPLAWAQPDLARLQTALDATPVGGWAKVSLGTWSDVFPEPRYSGNPGSIAYAWGSMAWDSQRGNLILWGGGHANYAGNEVYQWSAASGLWSRGTLPSALDASQFVVGNGAPQSSHTYDNQLYLPISDRYITFGGAAWNSGSNFASASGREGPWLWNPALADPNRVGGQDFTGLNPTALGSNSWQSRRGSITGTLPQSFVEAATGYRAEAGRDVVYIAADVGASGFPRLYRYEVNLAGTDTVQQVGVMGAGQFALQGTATVDSSRGWFIRTIWPDTGNDLAVWDLSRNNAATPGANPSFPVALQRPDGTPVNLITGGGGAPIVGSDTAINFDPATGHYWTWQQDGKVNEIIPATNPDGTPAAVWTVIERPCTSALCAQSINQNVLGHWINVPELGSTFIAIDAYDASDRSVDVWLYKAAAEVPEPATWVQLAAGFAVLGGLARRRRIGGI